MVEIDPLADIEFNYNYITPTGPEMIRAEPEDISITVVKEAKVGDVPIHLDDNGKFKAGLGTYIVGYEVRNKIDNFQGTTVGRIFIVTDKDDLSNVRDESGIITINYVPGYGVNLWKNHNVEDGTEKLADGTDRKLMTGSAWKYDQVAEDVYGNIWYRLGTNQWVQGDYVNKTPIAQPNSWEITNVEGVGTVNYVPGYGVNLWTSPDQTTFTKKLAHATAWKYFKIAKKDGKVMYNLGGDQWVDGQYFK